MSKHRKPIPTDTSEPPLWWYAIVPVVFLFILCFVGGVF